MKTLRYIYVAVKEHDFFWWRLFLLSLNALLIVCGLVKDRADDVIAGAFFSGMLFITIVDDVAERVTDLELKNLIKGDRQ